MTSVCLPSLAFVCPRSMLPRSSPASQCNPDLLLYFAPRQSYARLGRCGRPRGVVDGGTEPQVKTRPDTASPLRPPTRALASDADPLRHCNPSDTRNRPLPFTICVFATTLLLSARTPRLQTPFTLLHPPDRDTLFVFSSCAARTRVTTHFGVYTTLMYRLKAAPFTRGRRREGLFLPANICVGLLASARLHPS